MGDHQHLAEKESTALTRYEQIAQALAIVTDANEDQLNAAEEILLNQYEDQGTPCIPTCVTTEKVKAGPEAGESLVQDPGMEMPVISDPQPEEHNGAALETGFAYNLTPVTAIPNATMTERLKKEVRILLYSYHVGN